MNECFFAKDKKAGTVFDKHQEISYPVFFVLAVTTAILSLYGGMIIGNHLHLLKII